MSRLLLIPLGLVALLACTFLWSRSAAPKPADFTFINRDELATLDPNRMSWLQDIRVGYALWEGLYSLDPQTLEPTPGVASQIDVTPDKTIYTFHIRPEAEWNDDVGSPVLADDFVFAWRRMLEEPGEYTYLLHYIQGAEEFEESYARNGHTADFSNVGIKAIAPHILRVTLKHPVTFFPDLCAFPTFFPLNQKSMERFANEPDERGHVTYQKAFTRPPYLVSNGPFKLVHWDFKRGLRLEQSPYYWDRAHVKSHSIEMVDSVNPQWAFLKYDSGAIDWIAEVTGEIPAELRKQGRKDLHIFPGFGTYFYSINCLPKLPGGRTNPLADVRVRQALAMAIEKQPIVDTVTRMGEHITANYIPVGVFPGYHSPPGLPLDVALARRLLAEAGYPGGEHFPRLTVLFNTGGQHGDIAQVVRRQLEQNLGIHLELEPVEIKVFRERLHTKDYDIARASWIGDYNDVSTFTDKYLSTSDNNDSGWVNTQYDELCHKAEYEPDPAKRLMLLSQAEGLLCQEVPILPIYSYVNAYLYRDNVHGIPLNPRDMINFKSVWVNH